MSLRRKILEVGLLCGVFAAGNAWALPTYRIVELPLPAGMFSSYGLGINNTGEAVGSASDNSINTPVAWNLTTGAVRTLPVLSPQTAQATSVNDSGTIVGYSVSAAKRALDEATLWSTDGGIHILGDLPGGAAQSFAYGINAAGTVAGVGVTSGHNLNKTSFHAFMAPLNGALVDLGELPTGVDRSQANAINNAGTVVGYGSVQSGQSSVKHAFVWTSATGMQDIGTLPGDVVSEAIAVNSSGVVVGYSSGSIYRPFMWTPSGGMQTLGSSVTGVEALGINDAGVIVGSAGGVVSSAFVWTSSTGAVNLLSLIDPADPLKTSFSAGNSFTISHINTAGQIIGTAILSGEIRAVVLQPE